MSDEGDAEFSVGGQPRLVSLAASPGHGGMAHQARELRGSFPKRWVAQCLLDHLKGPRRSSADRRDGVLNILDDSVALQAAFLLGDEVRW